MLQVTMSDWHLPWRGSREGVAHPQAHEPPPCGLLVWVRTAGCGNKVWLERLWEGGVGVGMEVQWEGGEESRCWRGVASLPQVQSMQMLTKKLTLLSCVCESRPKMFRKESGRETQNWAGPCGCPRT